MRMHFVLGGTTKVCGKEDQWHELQEGSFMAQRDLRKAREERMKNVRSGRCGKGAHSSVR